MFIFNRIKIVEANRTMEVLSLENENSERVPLVKIKLGVGFPIKTGHTGCTGYMKYLIEKESRNRNKSKKKRSVDQRSQNAEQSNTVNGDSTENSDQHAMAARPISFVSPKFLQDDYEPDDYYPHQDHRFNFINELERLSENRVNLCGNSISMDEENIDIFDE